VEAVALLAHANAAGYCVEARDGDLLVNGPHVGHEAIIEALRAAKPSILAALQGAAADAPAPESAAVDAVLIDGRLYSRPAAELLRRSVPFVAAREGECRCCGGAKFWRLCAKAPWTCARCHPNKAAMSLPTTEMRDA
jgi:hypothetical protein